MASASAFQTGSLSHPLGYARRAHRKSRTGCATCKARKIKCDERHPACLNCISHGAPCPFLTVKTAPRRPGKQTPSQLSPIPPSPSCPSPSCPSPSCPSPLPPHPSDADADNPPLPFLELELLHNFTTHTYATLAADPAICAFWREVVVSIGLAGCPYITRTILAISALHLAHRRPDRRAHYTTHALLLHRAASRGATALMGSGGGGGGGRSGGIASLDDAVNLFLFSMLTIYFGKTPSSSREQGATHPRRSLPDGSFFIGDAALPDWAFLINGAKSLSAVLGEQGRDTVLAPFLEYGGRRWSAQREPDGRSAGGGGEAAGGVEVLRARIREAVGGQPALLATYGHAGEGPRDVLDAMLWLWEVSDSLVPLLKSDPARDLAPAQEAVAIFAHFCILLKHHESHWWLQGWGDHLISRAYDILDAEHRSWIEWPMREIGWVPPCV
ncbi:hypothetical protein B0H67DRAFT_597958 [Lasiosphaeris hirsuta]|uniref:Zn(2)-C6 fungal-type domain-containing protein n=1 Tax=Lasiosphaeris hirsuta TaxID=260670 RepID=A0AA40E257_9PEZI|nr:hypothetical protein B0H67DRAFT_597958 [Lasiosphaeris hirsuta]